MMSFEMNTDGTRVLVQGAANRAAQTRPVMEDFAQHMEGSVQENFRAGGRPDKWEPSRSENALIKSARLMNSVTSRVNAKGMQVGSNVRYGRLQHYGGTIVPKKAKALAIPLHDWIKVGPRRYSDLVYVPPQNGDPDNKGILGQKRSKGRGKKKKNVILPLFALRASVTVKAKPWLLFQNEDLTYVKAQLARFIETGGLQ